MIIFGDRLRELRAEKQLSQADLAKQLRLTKSAVNMYERGEREPSFEVLESIADYFNVDMDYMLGKSDTRSSTPISVPVQSEPAISPAKAKIADITKDMSDEQIEDIIRYAEFIKQRGL